MQLNDWVEQKVRCGRNLRNREVVMARARYVKNRIAIRLAIGLTICDVLEFKKGSRIKVFVNQREPNLILIKKVDVYDNTYKLGHTPTGNFLTFDIRWKLFQNMKVDQSMQLTYEMKQDKSLMVSIDNLYYEE